MNQQIVIIGAGYSGIGTAHKLLKYTRPNVPNLKVILISPTTHHFWNLAAVRGIIPGEFADSALFNPIESGFDKYPENAFEFVIGSATGVDTNAKTVSVKTNQGLRTINYAELVIATGSSYPTSVPFSSTGTYDEALSNLHDWQCRIKDATSIVIAGAGPSGLEVAGELANKYHNKKRITLVIPGDLPLPGLSADVGKTAADELEKLQIDIVRGARVESSQPAGNQTWISLSTGALLITDLYIPLFGMRPNTQFLPRELLDDHGNLKLDNSLRASGVDNVWGVGDVGNIEPKQLIYAERQAIHLSKNLDAHLTGKSRGIKDLKQTVMPQVFVTIGKKKGTGQYGGIRIPGFFVSAVKAKTFFSEKGPGLVAGDNIVRSSI